MSRTFLRVTADPDHIPEALRAAEPQPRVTDILVVDERVPLIRLFKALAEAGYSVINNRGGKLVITENPADFRGT